MNFMGTVLGMELIVNIIMGITKQVLLRKTAPRDPETIRQVIVIQSLCSNLS